jgi:hypothetical protein
MLRKLCNRGGKLRMRNCGGDCGLEFELGWLGENGARSCEYLSSRCRQR